MAGKISQSGMYKAIISWIFAQGYRKGCRQFSFLREDIETAATRLGFPRPKNLGDVPYSFRYRNTFPDDIASTQPEGLEWVIQGAGDAKYLFKLIRSNRISPNPKLLPIKIPDATPEIIGAYALSDEQALLAKVRYNRLIDLFLGVTAYSLQNHLRTKVPNIGQIEIDEVYVGVDKHGRQYVIPVQAKGGHDHHGVVQTFQDIAWCAHKQPNLICRPVCVQFATDTEIAMLELSDRNGDLKIVDEKHYELVPADRITLEDLNSYKLRDTTPAEDIKDT